MGKSTVNGPLSITMLNYQKVHPIIPPSYFYIPIWITRMPQSVLRVQVAHVSLDLVVTLCSPRIAALLQI